MLHVQVKISHMSSQLYDLFNSDLPSFPISELRSFSFGHFGIFLENRFTV